MLVRNALHRDARKLTLAREVENIIRRQSLANNGVWYDPSDLSTLYQDAAGTVPVTAVEQPVGLMLDKSGRGNHASQSTAGYKAILSARYNALLSSEDFTSGSWLKTGISSVVANADGVGDLLTADATTGQHRVSQDSATLGSKSVFSVRAKAGTATWLCLLVGDGSNGIAYFNLAAGAVGSVVGTVTATVSPVIDLPGYYDCTIACPAAGGTLAYAYMAVVDGAVNFAGEGKTLYLARADLRNDNAAPPTINKYQRVNTASDYDTVGFPKYLRFDGADDFLVTGNVDFSSTDKIAVAAGITKLGDAATGVVCQLSSDWQVNNGAFGLYAPGGAGSPRADYLSKGTAPAVATDSAIAAPVSTVLSGVSRIGADIVTLRTRGVQKASKTTDQGTGNYGNYPLYIGKNALASSAFNGRLYGLVVAGGLDDIYNLKKIERFLAQKTGVII